MKIGILTHYYGSNNYGGVLQAYALVKVLRDMGYDAEQICFPLDEHKVLNESCVIPVADKGYISITPHTNLEKRHSLLRKTLSRIKSFLVSHSLRQYARRKKQMEKNEFFAKRKILFEQFRNSIPHSPFSYTLNTLFLTNDHYDAFITGSDQVWNFQWQRSGFFLEFVDENKKRIAYAASAGDPNFDWVQQKYLKRILPTFDAVSVREKDLVEAYSLAAGINATYVLDPVLLLDRSAWDSLASEQLINENYLFCMFYNPTPKPYQLAKEYASTHHLKIVNLSYALMDTNISIDDEFGDYKIGAASPKDFISLIKYAECVFTDSFHCNAFSILFDKPFFTFGRVGMGPMNSRISSLTELFGCEQRFCLKEEQLSLSYLESVPNQQYQFNDYYLLKDRSISFLKGGLGENDT